LALFRVRTFTGGSTVTCVVSASLERAEQAEPAEWGSARRTSIHWRARCARLGSFVEIPVDLNFGDGSSLILSLVIGCFGFVCFAYGKRQQRFPQMLAGVILSVYPYFVSNLILMAAIAVAILALLGVAIRLGI
jgi:hypothetical protein